MQSLIYVYITSMSQCPKCFRLNVYSQVFLIAQQLRFLHIAVHDN